MKIHDISLIISPEMPIWPGDPPLVLEQVESMDAGAHANVSRLECSVHTGTHVDAPHHFLNNGQTVESMPLETLCGPALVIEIPRSVELLTASILTASALLLKTRNSEFWQRGENNFQENFVAIAPDGAEWLVSHGVKLVGVDYLSVAPFKNSDATHNILLEEGIVIVEGLDLSTIMAGTYDLYCLPLKLAGSDGAPARVILVG
jgi:arylformamidase